MAKNFEDILYKYSMARNFNDIFYKFVLMDDSKGVFEREVISTHNTFEEASKAAYELEQKGGKALVQCWDRPNSWIMCNGPDWKDYYETK